MPVPAPDDVVLVDVADRVATVTINRPDARNALNRAVQQALPEAIETLEADDGVDVVILTGSDPAFSAGVDLKELAAGGIQLVVPREQHGPLPGRTKPLIGAINGVAVTGGFELALNCDFLIASDRARFADTHTRVGVQPGWGLTVLLPQAIGVRRARQMSLTGNYIDASTALAWGLVNEVVAHDELLPRCRALASDIVGNDQAGVRRMLRTYHEGSLGTDADAWALETKVSRDWARSNLDPAEVGRRREAILERGRAQTSG